MIAGAVGAEAVAESAAPVVRHLFILAVLFGCEHGLECFVAFGHQVLHLLHLFLGQQVVVLVDGFGLGAKVVLSCLDLCYLVIAEIEAKF